uniref:Uncharacterized protein n=1 Tax=Amorphochlora amoebiformis TaxID=1561963 RepID=A0A7S0DT89_9EUKA
MWAAIERTLLVGAAASLLIGVSLSGLVVLDRYDEIKQLLNPQLAAEQPQQPRARFESRKYDQAELIQRAKTRTSADKDSDRHVLELKNKSWNLYKIAIDGGVYDPESILIVASHMLKEAEKWAKWDGEVYCKLGLVYEALGDKPNAIKYQKGGFGLIVALDSQHGSNVRSVLGAEAPLTSLELAKTQDWWISRGRLARLHASYMDLNKAGEYLMQEAMMGDKGAQPSQIPIGANTDGAIAFAMLSFYAGNDPLLATKTLLSSTTESTRPADILAFGKKYLLSLFMYSMGNPNSDDLSTADPQDNQIQPPRQPLSLEVLKAAYGSKALVGIERAAEGSDVPVSDAPLGIVMDDVLPKGVLTALRSKLSPESKFWRGPGLKQLKSNPSFFEEWSSLRSYIGVVCRRIWEAALSMKQKHALMDAMPTPEGVEWSVQELDFTLGKVDENQDVEGSKEKGSLFVGGVGGKRLHFFDDPFAADNSDLDGPRRPLLAGELMIEVPSSSGPSIIVDYDHKKEDAQLPAQVIHSRLNRVVLFPGHALHGVLPGPYLGSRSQGPPKNPTNRLSILFAFWEHGCSPEPERKLGRCQAFPDPAYPTQTKDDQQRTTTYRMRGAKWANELSVGFGKQDSLFTQFRCTDNLKINQELKSVSAYDIRLVKHPKIKRFYQ